MRSHGSYAPWTPVMKTKYSSIEKLQKRRHPVGSTLYRFLVAHSLERTEILCCQHLKYHLSEGIATVAFNKPKSLNALKLLQAPSITQVSPQYQR